MIATFVFLCLLFNVSLSITNDDQYVTTTVSKSIYIVQVYNKAMPLDVHTDPATWYRSILDTVTTTEIIHVYYTVFHGFCAQLTDSEAVKLTKLPEILNVFPDRVHQLHTTRSPHFLGLDTLKSSTHDQMEESDVGSDVIIGVIDSGIWPEHPSFYDHGLPDVPSRWKGECIEGDRFPKNLCNKKLIGARYYTNGSYENSILSARDTDGHGTSTASIAADRLVHNASVLGFASGSAMGIAPKARIAVYKVCWGGRCPNNNIIKGIDQAVIDGVDIISVSIGYDIVFPYSSDPISISSYNAMRHGVFVSTSAGNEGPKSGSVNNIAPWMITVGASSIDQSFPADLVVEDGPVFTGSSLYNGWYSKEYVPVVHVDNANGSCWDGTIDHRLVRGKIAICNLDPEAKIKDVEQSVAVNNSGGIATVSANGPGYGEYLKVTPHLFPGIRITHSVSKRLSNYLNSTTSVKARLQFRGTQFGINPAPAVTRFSSRGPNAISNYVTKPDVIAPGLDILTGWPPSVPLTTVEGDNRNGSEFNIHSGTSFACPHVSGLGALLKGAHPEWSPAMIKSALMTTAYTRDHAGNKLLDDFNYKNANIWAMGAGHVNPKKALDPGFVYDIAGKDYLTFLCMSGLNKSDLETITHKSAINCSDLFTGPPQPWNLNYPIITVALNASWHSKHPEMVEVKRTATYVSENEATYKVVVSPPKGCRVKVVPKQMKFRSKYENITYVVRIYGRRELGKILVSGRVDAFGKLEWKDTKKKLNGVVTPMVVSWM